MYVREAEMATKLTLRMDEDLIEHAKRIARERGKSVSRLVADYFALLGREPEGDELPPLTRGLFGVAAGSEVEESDHRRHLEEKHR